MKGAEVVEAEVLYRSPKQAMAMQCAPTLTPTTSCSLQPWASPLRKPAQSVTSQAEDIYLAAMCT